MKRTRGIHSEPPLRRLIIRTKDTGSVFNKAEALIAELMMRVELGARIIKIEESNFDGEPYMVAKIREGPGYTVAGKTEVETIDLDDETEEEIR